MRENVLPLALKAVPAPKSACWNVFKEDLMYDISSEAIVCKTFDPFFPGTERSAARIHLTVKVFTEKTQFHLSSTC